MYELKPEYAGRLLECPACGRHLRAGSPPGSTRSGASQGDPEAFDRDVFLLRERVFTIRSKYEVWAEDGTAILYVERPTYPLRTLVAYLAGLVAGFVVLARLGYFAETAGPLVGPLLMLLALPATAFVFMVISMFLKPPRSAARTISVICPSLKPRRMPTIGSTFLFRNRANTSARAASIFAPPRMASSIAMTLVLTGSFLRI